MYVVCGEEGGDCDDVCNVCLNVPRFHNNLVNYKYTISIQDNSDITQYGCCRQIRYSYLQLLSFD